MTALFADRREAGLCLALHLAAYAGRPDVIVLALPRGGVPVAFEVAAALSAPLDVFLVRKLGLPGHEELAMGAVASGGVRVVNDAVVEAAEVSPGVIDAVTATESRVLEQRERLYRGDRPPTAIAGQVVVLVDDGLATGTTMRAGLAALRQRSPASLVVAVPVAAPTVCAALRSEADEVVCAYTPEPFYAVGMWYADFSQTTDEEVRALLSAARQPDPGGVTGT